MIRWNNDYNQTAHPAILEVLTATAQESYNSYGIDEWCDRGAAAIKKYLNKDADIHFMVGGTQVNYTVISAALRSYQSVISADSGHINVHETGAVENTGHKIHALPSENGKITAAQIARKAEIYRISDIKEHITQPKMVYLSFPTEYGTLYTKDELCAIREVCDKYGLFLFIDGARLGYALGSIECDITLADLAVLCDVFYIGGTKCGAMFGEAVVIINPVLKEDFRSYIKQNGAMLAKGWLLGLQFAVLFEDGLYLNSTKAAVEYALRIKAAFHSVGIPSFIDSSTNQQFVVVTKQQMDKLAKRHIFEYDHQTDDTHHCIRFCTSWSTRDEDVGVLIGDIANL